MTPILMRLLWIGSVAGQAAVLSRIWITADLRFPYAFFASFLAANLSRSLLLVGIDYRSPAYTLIWTASEPLLLILQLLAVNEVYDRICAVYPGIGRYKYRLFATTAVLATAVSIITLVMGIPRMIAWRYFVTIGIKSFIAASSVAFLILLWALFRHFPVARGGNLQLHWRLITVYFGLNAAGLMAMMVLPGRVWINMALLASVTVCYTIWAVKLTASGEVARVPSSDAERRQWTATQERVSALLGRISVRELLWLVWQI